MKYLLTLSLALVACNNVTRDRAGLPDLDSSPEETKDLVEEAGKWFNRPGQEHISARISCEKATGICSFAQVYDRESWVRVLYARCGVGKGCRYYGGQ